MRVQGTPAQVQEFENLLSVTLTVDANVVNGELHICGPSSCSANQAVVDEIVRIIDNRQQTITAKLGESIHLPGGGWVPWDSRIGTLIDLTDFRRTPIETREKDGTSRAEIFGQVFGEWRYALEYGQLDWDEALNAWQAGAGARTRYRIRSGRRGDAYRMGYAQNPNIALWVYRLGQAFYGTAFLLDSEWDVVEPRAEFYELTAEDLVKYHVR